MKALGEKFPGTVWLVGSAYLEAAAAEFARRHPPETPCIAEYGWNFPGFLAALPGSARVPYVGDFAQLEWCVGHVSIAIREAPLAACDVARSGRTENSDTVFRLQPGLFYFQAGWPVDALLRIFVSGDAPDRLEFDRREVFLEIRGARGDFTVNRLGRAEFVFRRALSEGECVGSAAKLARDLDPGFEAGPAFRSMLGEGLVIGVDPCWRTGDEGEAS